ncbi:MAG TPA: YceI family protein [Candidatus Paceibacterota bacterium]|jgi:polyisoprenoid-binding protein YceI|nr:YceI family protein [Candidatus Paceibacterota bacterium]
MKRFLVILIIVALAVGAFFYFTRPIAVPTNGVQSTTESLALTPDEATGAAIYHISQDESSVSFSAHETLAGAPNTAVGTTHQIAADIAIVQHADSAPIIKISPVKIDARTFVTDSTQRDGAINRFILKTETPGNEYITFVPRTVHGPTSITQGQEFQVTIEGDMTISGVTKPETLTALFTQNGDRLNGTVQGTIKRSDFGLTIPSIPFVADVSDEIPVSATCIAHADSSSHVPPRAPQSSTGKPVLE